MGSKGSSSSSQPNATSSYSGSTPPPDVLAQYQALMGQVGNVASQPLQQYQGPLVAPFNATQNQAFNQINNSTGLAQPAIQGGEGLVAASAAPITPDVTNTTESFMDPYLQTAVGNTEKQFQNQNEQQQEQLTGQAIGAGAYGGDRAGVAAAELANQQDLAEGQTISGMENSGYQSAQNAAINTLESDAGRAGQAGTELGALGNESQAASLAGANAELGAGTLQQQLSQEELNIPYEEFVQQQAYPFQTTGWEAGIDEALGSLEGGTSYSTPTPPNPYTTAAGLGLAGVGIAGLAGAFGGGDPGNGGGGGVKRGGRIHRDAGGLVPTIGASLVPTVGSTSGKGPPNPVANSGHNLVSDVSPLKDLGSVANLIKSGKKIAKKASPKDGDSKPAGQDAAGNNVDGDGNVSGPEGTSMSTGNLGGEDSVVDPSVAQQANLGGGPPPAAETVATADAGVTDASTLADVNDAAMMSQDLGTVADLARRGGRIRKDKGGSAGLDPYALYGDGYSANDVAPVDNGLSSAEYLQLLEKDFDGNRRGGRISKDDGGEADDTDIEIGDQTGGMSEVLPDVMDPSKQSVTGGTTSKTGNGPPAPVKIDAGSTTTSGGQDNTLQTVAQVAEIAAMFAKRGGRIKRDLGGPVPMSGAQPGMAPMSPGGLAPVAANQDPQVMMAQRLAMQNRMMPSMTPPQRPSGAFSASPLQAGGGGASTGGVVAPTDMGQPFGKGGLVARGFAEGGEADDDDMVIDDDGEYMPIGELKHKQVAQVPEEETSVTEPEPTVIPESRGAPRAAAATEDDDAEESEGVSAHNRLNNPWLALASAGFGMAGSSSPNAGQAIAQGAGDAIKTLGKQADSEVKAQKLHNDAEKAAKQFASQEKHYTVMQTNAERAAAAAEARAKAAARLATVAEGNKDADRHLREVQADAALRRAAAAETNAGHGKWTPYETEVPVDPNDPSKGTKKVTKFLDSSSGSLKDAPDDVHFSGKPGSDRPGAIEHAANTYLQQWNHDHPDQPITYDQALTASHAQARDNTENSLRLSADKEATRVSQELPKKGQPQVSYRDALIAAYNSRGLGPDGRMLQHQPARPAASAATPGAAPVVAPAVTPSAATAPAAAVPAGPPKEAIEMLKAKPALAAKFDIKYGKGAAAAALAN